MRNIIKKINMLAAGAMIVGGGFAFASANATLNPEFFMDPADNQWKPLVRPIGDQDQPGTYRCNEAVQSACTGAYNPLTGLIEIVDHGLYTEN